MHQTDRRYFDFRTIVLATALIVVGICVIRVLSGTRAENPTPAQQDVLRLENRITQLEQRLYGIENSVRTVEQQSRLGTVSSRTVSQDEMNLLRSEVQRIGQRLDDDECGLAKLDERTLSPQQRQTRRRTATSNSEQCRNNADAPLRLP
jgi:predicted  nucleic acid-binding Zn-ribbon protein